MPANIGISKRKPISVSVPLECSQDSGCPSVMSQHRQALTNFVGVEKGSGSPMALSNVPCDGSFKTLSLTPCDIDYGSTPQEIKAQKNVSISSKDRFFSQEGVDGKTPSLSSLSARLGAKLKYKDPNRGSSSSLKSMKTANGTPLDPRLNIPLFFPVSQWSSRYGIQFFTVDVPKVDVTEAPEKGPKGGFAVYTVQIKRGRQVLLRKYRYSQFLVFHNELLRSDIAILIKKGKIFLPTKTWFRNISVNFLEQRRKKLEKYLHSLLLYKYVPSVSIVQKFLGLNEFVIKDFWIDH